MKIEEKGEGVIRTRVGYTGGANDNPTYGNHPGHAEAVEIVFDPERISYRDILEFFFQIHDPTTIDRQGNDVGSSYRSEIFYTSDEQRQVAERAGPSKDDRPWLTRPWPLQLHGRSRAQQRHRLRAAMTSPARRTLPSPAAGAS